ncbi:MAG: hypothetical protein M3O50_13175, partial [Myxococcota bacterium]|nr:hypothetical protein [Myxococcota bacterium]
AERPPSVRLLRAAVAVGAIMVASLHAWVLVPSLVRLAPRSYDARLDIANELYGWPEVIDAVREEARDASPLSPRMSEGAGAADAELAVVGPHWVVCAQLEARLRGDLRVGCDTPQRDDFDAWWPRDRWRRADTVLWVTDTRFGRDPHLPSHAVARTREVHIQRGGRVVRVFAIMVLVRRAAARLDEDTGHSAVIALRPASRSSARSSSASGLGVVSSLSP